MSGIRRLPVWLTALTAVAALALIAPAGASAAKPKRPSAVAVERAMAELRELGIPGVVVHITTPEGTETFVQGDAGGARGRPIRAADRYRIGSVTKVVTAIRLLQLAEQGRVTLDDPVERWLPGLVPNGSAITLRHLLSHTSGLADYRNAPSLRAAVLADPGRAWAPRDLVAFAATLRRAGAPGAVFRYADTNFVLAGLVIEAVTGRPAADELREFVLGPGGAGTAFLASDTAMPAGAARGFELPADPDGDTVDVTGTLNPTLAFTAGGIVAGAPELSRLAAALFGGRLLRPETLGGMITPVRSLTAREGGHIFGRVGLGLFEAKFACGAMWGHDGEFPGYKGILLSSADGKRRVVVWVNASRLSDEAKALNRRVWRTAACRALLG